MNKEKMCKPKFKVGDWIINECGTVRVIEAVDTLGYQTDGGWLTRAEYEKHFRLWQLIEDAKDGDVLANDHHILILKELVYDWSSNGIPYSVKAYCGIKPNGNFEIGKDNWCFCGTLHIHPATKEQRDTLFAKMKENGYRWDADKKELEKIEDKPTWTEEDEKFFKAALWHISYSITNGENTDCKCDTIEWLKHLKERIKGG